MILGSVQESDEIQDFSGLYRYSLESLRSRRRGGNVETRVVCGFPSAGDYDWAFSVWLM